MLVSDINSKDPAITYMGTRIEMPVTLPLSAGRTAATAFAAPVSVGIMLLKTPRPIILLAIVQVYGLLYQPKRLFFLL